ncbi:hypothetical protein BH11ACT6_BH11ACT6_35540 [soil metagenome]
MVFRVNVPEGSVAHMHILQNVGTPELLARRFELVMTIYDAPETTLSPREREIIRMLYASRFSCEICTDVRLWRDQPGFSETRIDEGLYLAASRVDVDWPGFTERERLVLDVAQRFDVDIDGLAHDDDMWQRVRAEFTETEIGDLFAMLGSLLGVGRSQLALGVGPKKAPIPALDGPTAPVYAELADSSL